MDNYIDMTIEELKQNMERCRKEVLRIISMGTTPEVRHELATKQLEWLKNVKKEWGIE